MKWFMNWFGDIKIFKSPMFIVFGNTSYKMKGPHERAVLNIIKKGDVLLRRYEKFISGRLIPGFYTHAAVYIGDDRVIHAIGKGVCNEDILTFMHCDYVAVLRPPEGTDADKTSKLALECVGLPYDWAFEFKNDHRYTCTELVHHCLVDDLVFDEDIKKILPDNFLRSNLQVVLETKDI